MSSPTTRERLLGATVQCIDAGGMSGFSLEDVARRAGVSRATIYRQFPDGRDQILREAITQEIAEFWLTLADYVSESPDLETRLVDGIIEARRQIVEHALLQRLLDVEPHELVPAMAEVAPLIHDVLVRYITVLLEREGANRAELEVGADYLARLLLSYVATPGSWDLADRDAVRRLVVEQFTDWIVPQT